VRDRSHALGAALLQRVAASGGLAPIAPVEDHALMFPLPVHTADPEALRRRLCDTHRIEVPVTTHAGRSFVRVSVAGYTTADDLRALETALAVEDRH
jgi:isopenicillin-N epimerase